MGLDHRLMFGGQAIMAASLIFIAFGVAGAGVLIAFLFWLVLQAARKSSRYRRPPDEAPDLLEQAQDAVLRLSPNDRAQLRRWLEGMQPSRPAGPSDAIKPGL
jgi:hypothetical protein